MVTCRALSAGAKSGCKQELLIPRASPPHLPAQDQDRVRSFLMQGLEVLVGRTGKRNDVPHHSGGDSWERQSTYGRKSERHRSQEAEKGLRPFGTGLVSVELEKNPVPSTFFQQLPLPRPSPQSVVLSGSSSCFPGGPGWKGTWSAPSTQSLPFGLTGLSLCFQPTTDRHPTSLQQTRLFFGRYRPDTTERGSCCPQGHQLQPSVSLAHQIQSSPRP